MVLDKNYKQLAGWSALPPDLLWYIQPAMTGTNSTDDALEYSAQPSSEEDQRSKAKAHEEDIFKVLEVFSQNNPATPLEPEKKPKSWLRKSLSVIGRALRDSDQTQHINRTQELEKEKSAQASKHGSVITKLEAARVEKSDDTEKEQGHKDSMDLIDTSEEEDIPVEAQPLRVIANYEEHMFLNITPGEEPKEKRCNEEVQNDSDDLKDKVERLASFVNKTESTDQGKEHCTKASQAFQDSTMKDRKVTEAMAAAVIIGAGILHVLSGGMSPDIPDSDIIAIA